MVAAVSNTQAKGNTMANSPPGNFTSTLLFTIWRVVRAVLVVILMVILMLVYFEESMIFPAPPPEAGEWQVPGLGLEDAYFTTSDGVKLHGWFIEHPDPQAIVLFAHGNGVHLGFMGSYLEMLHRDFRCTVLAYDYRGYGKSEGHTTGAGLLLDARAAHDWLCRRTGASPLEIVVIGRSMGGAASVEVAAAHGARGLVLERTFSSLPDVAAHHLWWAPVKLLMRTRLNSQQTIQHYHGPLLQSHGDADQVVPIRFGKRLFEACPSSQKMFLESMGGGHTDPLDDAYLQQLHAFLKELPARGQPPGE